ncbi:MAG: hypothetical protein ACRDKG_16810, partial [Actinomycetota bacterium]
GSSTDIPIAGDWDGDGKDTPGLVRANRWYLNEGYDGIAETNFAYGNATDAHIAGDWDGSGSSTVGIVRAAHWFLSNDNASEPHDILFSDEGW